MRDLSPKLRSDQLCDAAWRSCVAKLTDDAERQVEDHRITSVPTPFSSIFPFLYSTEGWVLLNFGLVFESGVRKNHFL